jgi:hypothetical protein
MENFGGVKESEALHFGLCNLGRFGKQIFRLGEQRLHDFSVKVSIPAIFVAKGVEDAIFAALILPASRSVSRCPDFRNWFDFFLLCPAWPRVAPRPEFRNSSANLFRCGAYAIEDNLTLHRQEWFVERQRVGVDL